MQPVLDGEVLQIAEPGIDLAQRLVRMELARKSRLAREPGASRRLDDEPRQALAPAAVEPVGDGIFIDQALELLRRAASAVLTSGGGRWPMVMAAMRRLAWAASPGLLTMKG